MKPTWRCIPSIAKKKDRIPRKSVGTPGKRGFLGVYGMGQRERVLEARIRSIPRDPASDKQPKSRCNTQSTFLFSLFRFPPFAGPKHRSIRPTQWPPRESQRGAAHHAESDGQHRSISAVGWKL